MALLISDANVLIDMQSADILNLMFSLPDAFAVPDVLYLEELAQQHGHLPGLGLQVLEIREQFVAEAYRLRGIHKKAGLNDLLALALAKQEACPILTGDRFLRDAAEIENVEVRGTLWLMERLFIHRLLDRDALNSSYEKMLAGGRRLPRRDIDEQLLRLTIRR